MILFFYNLALLAALLAGVPWWLWRMATTHKYREGIGERLGCVPKRLRGFADKPTLWLHAVSVGEVLAVSRLVEEIGTAFPGCRLLISTTTRTGQALARERFGADRVLYCPLDLPWAVRAYLNAIRPSMLILAETEFWPNLLNGCFRRQIPVAVVNARISDRSWPRYQKLRRLWRPILGQLSRVLAQTEVDARRLIALGCRPERVSISGNLKFDVRAAREAEATSILRAAGNGLRFVVAGSTLEGEEAALVESWPKLAVAEPNLAMVLAPRHPERFAAVAALLEGSGAFWVRRSEWKGEQTGAVPELRRGQIVLLDTIGELASVYSLASVAFVGGSIAEAGGHNPLEPAQFGVPIVMGPNYANFRAITEDLRSHDALRITTKEELAHVLIEMLQRPDEAQMMGRRAREVFERQSGATVRSANALRKILYPSLFSIPQPIDPEITAAVQRLRNDGKSPETILGFLRSKRLGKSDSIRILQELCEVPPAQAKQIVHRSDTWKDRFEADSRFHEQLFKELEEAAKDPDSGITIDETTGSILIRLDDEDKRDA